MARRAIQGRQMGRPAQGPNPEAELASLRNGAIKRRPEIRRTPGVRAEPATAAPDRARAAQRRQNADGFVTVLRPKRRNADAVAHQQHRLPPSAARESPEFRALAVGFGKAENLAESST